MPLNWIREFIFLNLFSFGPLPRYVNMKELKAFLKSGIFALAILFANNAKSQIIDQFDTTYNAGLSARTLSGYSWYQTFTAGITGDLTRVDIGFFNYIFGNGTLEVYEDTGITGNMIYTSLVTVNCPGNGCMLPFQVNCNVVAGDSYTFHFIPGIGMPDPFGVQQDFTNSYIGGEMYTIDPSGTYPFNMDLVFATYVKDESTGLEVAMASHNSLYHISESTVVLAENCKGELYTMAGQRIKLDDLPSGIYILKIATASKDYIFKISIK